MKSELWSSVQYLLYVLKKTHQLFLDNILEICANLKVN